MSTFSKNLNHRLKCREQKENFQTTLVVMFCNFKVFSYKSDSQQVKRNLISSIANLVYDSPHELLNDLRTEYLWKLGNFNAISDWGGDVTWYPLSLPEI